MALRFTSVMCAVALLAEGGVASQMKQPRKWKATRKYREGDIVKWNNQVWKCREWPHSEFCSIIDPKDGHRWVAWNGFQMPNVTECKTADATQDVQYAQNDRVCVPDSEFVFYCKSTPCSSSDLVESNFNNEQFWWRWDILRERGQHITPDDDDQNDEEENDNNEHDDHTEPDDNTKPDDNDDNTDPEPTPSEYYEIPERVLTPEEGPWTSCDWEHQKSGLKCQNGVVTGITAEAKRRLRSNGINFPIPLVNTATAESNPENVQRAMRVLNHKDWEYLTPLRLDFYTYDDFMQALAAFPGICSDKGEAYIDLTADEVCEREMAALFAHFSQEVGAHWSGTGGIQEEWRQSLYLRSEEWCTAPNWGGDYCNYYPTWDEWTIKDNAYPRRNGSVSYHGRGPLQLSWNYQYGPFSRQLFGDQFILLDDPERIIRDNHGVEAWLAAFWFYSTPQNPKPSMHEVVTGLWVPNQTDINSGNHAGFGQTTNIINGAIECGYANSQKANWRAEYYQGTADYFNIDISNEVLTCEDTNAFNGHGAARQYNYWYMSWDGSGQCQPVDWMTPYSVYTEGDYARCVLDYHS